MNPDPELTLEPAGPHFQDWSGIVSIDPQLYFKPRDLDELKAFLNNLSKSPLNHLALRVLGGLHSCSEICVSDAILDLSSLPKTLEFSPDFSSVTVSANWHFHEFLLALSQHGKSITATGGTDHQTLAGIISTNTAGATPHHTIYELVDWIEYLAIDPSTQSVVERRVSQTDPAFAAVIGSLGAIGILTLIHLRLVDQLYFETVQKIIKLNDVLADLDQTSRRYDFWRIDWIPDTDVGLLWAAKKIPSADPDGDYPADQAENILTAVFKVLDKVDSAGPLLDNAMRLLYSGLTLTYVETRVSGPLRNMLPVDRRAPLRVAMAEWAFDPFDLNRLTQACRDYFKRHGWPNLPIEIELTKTDSYDMSAWNWPGLEHILKFNFMYLTNVIGTPQEKALLFSHLRGLWDYLTQAGIPFKAHWGKINFIDPAFARAHYQFAQFEPFINPLFVNPYLSERFYPAPNE